MIQELFEGKPEKYEKELIGIVQIFDSSVEVISEKPSITRGVAVATAIDDNAAYEKSDKSI